MMSNITIVDPSNKTFMMHLKMNIVFKININQFKCVGLGFATSQDDYLQHEHRCEASQSSSGSQESEWFNIIKNFCKIAKSINCRNQ